ncbi:tyrosine-protein kinase domain-containing protein [Microlunatus ginsengisoli]|uniref:non-specific protein-tyrosine kinase n=1 Tax=Microlunatus ginsengisoli TaxID=363863 RepID=A0ABP6ZHE3_9ACTN
MSVTSQPARGRTSPNTPVESNRSALDLRTHVHALRRFWKSVVACTLLGLLIAIGISLLIQPKYETRTTFFVASTTSQSSSPLQADEFAQRRINSYVGVINSERLAKVVIDDTGLPLSTTEVNAMISASVDPDTVLMTVSVRDVSPERSMIISQSIAKNLDNLIGELDNRGNQNAVQLRVISGPTLNPGPVEPRWKLNLALGLLIGLGVGVAQALLRQQFDSTYRGREQLVDGTGLPILGSVSFESAAKRAPIILPTETRTRRAEAIRQLRTNLRYFDAASAVEVLVITSSVEAEGKTTTAANLAQAFAEAGRRTLLVDADLRKPKLERYLDLEGSAGLTSILIGEGQLAQVVQPWGPSGLDVLACGPIPPNPSELLGGPTMERFIADARAAYDLVIVDTPPLLPVTDAAVTSAVADGVILVVRHGKTRREQVGDALDSLASVDARVLGTVLSMVPAGRGDRLPTYYEDPVRTAEAG